MDVNKMIAELRAERELLEQGILALERIARGTGKRRGRPPKWMSAARANESIPAAKRKK
jgi:hypothetical protein